MGLREGGAEGEAKLLAVPLDGVAKGVPGAEALVEADVHVEPDAAAEALRQPLAEAELLPPPPPNGDWVKPLVENEVEGELLAAAL